MFKVEFNSQKFDLNFTQDDFDYFSFVRDDFLLDLKGRSKNIKMLLEHITYSENRSEDQLSECIDIAHSIKGTGFTLGFKFLSEVGLCIEAFLNFLVENPNLDLKSKESLIRISQECNKLLYDIINNYFLTNKEYNSPEEYNDKLQALLNKAEVFCSTNINK